MRRRQATIGDGGKSLFIPSEATEAPGASTGSDSIATSSNVHVPCQGQAAMA